MSGLIAIVGRPNVGKSALFNRIVGRRIAIVHDQPGVTRDRITAEAEWRGHPFTLVDTGGIGVLRGEKADDVLVRAAIEQVELALEAAQVILFVVNVQEGIVPLDREVAQRLRRAGKPVLVAVNKVDNDRAEAGVTEFAELGFDRLFPISAIHGLGVQPLMDAAFAFLPRANAVPLGEKPPAEDPPPEGATEKPDAAASTGPLKLAVVGRPNVGKSSIVNALTRSQRVIVSPIPGTTRDAIDVPFEVETDGRREQYLLIDTAGMRKSRRVNDTIEFFSVKRSEQSIERADLVIFVLDAESGIVEQDKKIADHIVAAKKGCIVVVNKWDLFADAVEAAREKQAVRKTARGERKNQRNSLADFAAWVQEKMFFLDYAPVIFTAAPTGFQLDRLLEAIRFVAGQLRQKIPTALLNRALHDAIERRQPVSSSGARLKFFYATQVAQMPPTFLLFVNRGNLSSPAYEKYLADQLRQAFGFEGCPIRLLMRARPKTIAPKRDRRGGAGGPKD